MGSLGMSLPDSEPTGACPVLPVASESTANRARFYSLLAASGSDLSAFMAVAGTFTGIGDVLSDWPPQTYEEHSANPSCGGATLTNRDRIEPVTILTGLRTGLRCQVNRYHPPFPARSSYPEEPLLSREAVGCPLLSF
jgi:hypothetical protein